MKGEYEIRDIINQFQKEISYYSQMEVLGTPYEKKYHQDLIKERTEDLIYLMEHYAERNYSQNETVPNTEPVPFTEPVPNTEPVPTTEPITSIQPPVTETQPGTEGPIETRTFTLEQLKIFNGTGGQPPYVAVNGVVYDLSSKSPWSGGSHFGLSAGNDLTGQFMSCHRGLSSMLAQLPVVGVLIP
jgi:predicted heme/steroid binding protein